MIEMYFKATKENLKTINDLNFAMCEALAGSEGFQKGDELFITPVEEIPEGYGFIAYFGAPRNDSPILVFEDCKVVSMYPDGKKKRII